MTEGCNDPPPDDHLRKNLALWETTSDEYEQRHRRSLDDRNAEAWGFWRIPESSLRLLGETAGRDVLELGCGAARWSTALARRGARTTGIDFSGRHLAHARQEVTSARVSVGLIRSNAERLPFRPRSFDVVFCDWGAMTFADPRRTIPEVSRVLRPAGRFVFSTGSPIRAICENTTADRVERKLLRPYFGLERLDYPKETNFQLPYGEWIRQFRANGLTVEELVEPRRPPGTQSSYLEENEARWAEEWPLESIWRLTRE